LANLPKRNPLILLTIRPVSQLEPKRRTTMTVNTEALTRTAILLALSAAIRSLATPIAAGAADHDTVITTALHIQTLADIVSEAAEGLLTDL
jgi:hypothetical protein